MAAPTLYEHTACSYNPAHQEPTIDLRPVPKTFDEIRAYKGFRETIDASVHKLEDVFSLYRFEKKIQCGLKGCGHWHNWGYWISTSDGLETAIGNKCGGDAFPEFESKRKAMTVRRTREDLITRFRALAAVGSKIETEIRSIMTGDTGEAWIRNARHALESAIGGKAFRTLVFEQQRGSIQVTTERERSDEEVERIWEAAGRRGSRRALKFEEVSLGWLASSEWAYFDFKAVLITGLMENVKQLRDGDPLSMTDASLRKSIKPFDEWESKISDAKRIIAGGRRFFAEDNMKLLALWIREPGPKSDLREWLASGGVKTLLS